MKRRFQFETAFFIFETIEKKNMTGEESVIIDKVEAFIQKEFSGEGSGHDWWHIYRVVQNAKHIASDLPQANGFVVELTALVHDLGDHKLYKGEGQTARNLIGELLNKLGVEASIIEEVITTVEGLSFKGAGVSSQLDTLEGQIVQDADRLDAIGAIGIARTFAYGGHAGHPIYDPTVSAEMHDSFESYKNNKGTTVNHFYEKLLLLKELMNTEPAKRIAEGRHQYMKDFLDRFYAEWEGRK